jgi:hypothetical protein
MAKNTNKTEFYLGNPNLPAADARIAYEPWMVKEMKKCKENILHFAENFFYIINLDRGRETINLHSCQKRVLRKMRDNRFFILLASRQIGKSTMMTIYILWQACFMDDQRILLVANKEATAIEIFQRVRMAFEELPIWLKPGVKEYGKTSMTLDNGSRIGITTTTGTAARGQSVNCLVIDEMAFIESHLVEEFWKSVFPIITSSKKSKVFVCSTANGTDNLFYKLYDGAEKGENGWAYDMIKWNEVPGRDEKWAANTKQALGSLEAWLQEFECQWLSSGESSIDEALFLEMSQKCVPAPIILDEGNYKIWEEPNPEKIYVAGVDISEGVGIDASVIQILDITDTRDIKQVAMYHNRHIPPLEFSNKLHTILLNWGSPLALIERNNCGAQVVDRLAFDIGYEKVVSYGAKAALRGRPQMGMIAHTNTKYKGVMNMRYFINETRSVTIQDLDTLKEMRDFVRHSNGTWKAKSGYHDDRVMSFMYGLYILEKEITERYFDIMELDDHGKPMIIEPMDFGVATFENATSIYNDFEVVGLNNPYMTPIVFGMGQGGTEQQTDMELLEQEGWKPYGR